MADTETVMVEVSQAQLDELSAQAARVADLENEVESLKAQADRVPALEAELEDWKRRAVLLGTALNSVPEAPNADEVLDIPLEHAE